MNETITWLHISDTHFCKENCEEVFDRFFIDLKSMEKEYGLIPDLVFFTGDIAFGQDNSRSLFLKDQYMEANKFIEKVLNSFSRKIPKENIFIVPGNHDIDRTQVTQDQTYWLKNLHTIEKENLGKIINELVKNRNKQWTRYMERLKDYRCFLEEGNYNHLLDDRERLIYSKVRQINGYKVGILGLNSAWSSSSDREYGSLWLGTYQIENSYNSLKDAMFSISLIHHPPSWFTEYEEWDIRRGIERKFKFCLHGHEHREWVSLIDQKHIKIAAGALCSDYGRENGYNFVRLYPEKDRGEIFLRKYNNGTWTQRIIGDKTDKNGVCNIEISIKGKGGKIYINDIPRYLKNDKIVDLNDLEKFKHREIPKNLTSDFTSIEFVLISAGKFVMGSSTSEKEGKYDEEYPPHYITIKNSFYMGKYPVTQNQWEKIMGSNPSCFKDEDQPVESVSWNDVQEFIAKLNEMDKTDKYRLPSEAEWEYACRAETSTKYSFGEDESIINEYAWYDENSGGKTHAVGQKKPNRWGLYDMHGNVCEWVQDKWHNNYEGAPSDGSAWEEGEDFNRVLRGGFWFNFAGECRSAARNYCTPERGANSLGFRLLREL